MGMRRRSRAIIAISASFSCLAALSSCDWISSLFPESFGPEYDDTSINYIASFPLEAPPAASDQGSVVALDAPGRWDWAWRGRTGNSFQYMTLSPAGTVGAAQTAASYTLAADEKVWRLELVNLAGDPYLEGAQHAAWTGGGGTVSSLAPTPVSHGRFIRLDSPPTAWSGFNPNVAGFMLDDPASMPTARYVLKAFSTDASVRYIIGDASGAVSFDDAPTSALSASRHAFDVFSVESADTRFMTGTSGATQTFDLDVLRFTRLDLEENARLRLRLRPSDAAPTLVAGKYEFSVWARWPDGALPYDSASRSQAANYQAPFASKRITLRVMQTEFLVERETPVVFQESYELSGDWTRLALRMDGGNLDRFDESTAEAVVELAVFPYDRQGMDCGSVLIAAPSLRFFKDGYTD